MAKKFSKIPSDYSKPKVVPGSMIPKSTENKTGLKKSKPASNSKNFKKENPEQKSSKRTFAENRKATKSKPEFVKRKPSDGLPTFNAPEGVTVKVRKKSWKQLEKEMEEEEEAALIIAKGKMPLNKYIAHCGICSRREAVDLIKKGLIKLNDKVVLEPGTKIEETDKVFYEDKELIPEQKAVYFLLNKPKDYITTTDDPEGRKTVMDLFKEVEDSRIFPVGRLDRNTTGLLLLTNDGDLAQKLSHPKNKIRKIYQVTLDKPLNKKDFEAIAAGLLLEDGKADIDEIAYTNPLDKKEIGIQIHIGRNRIVRRIFEHLGYVVKALDRVVYAGLTKKNLPRGKWRSLNEKEIIYLKHYK